MFRIKTIDNILDIYFKKSSHSELAKSSVLLAVWTSIFLVIIKILAWLLTKSISMQASLNDSCLDALTSFIAYHALKFSSIQYDKEHNFGHEKVEGIVAIFQCLIVTYSGFVICREAFELFFYPKPILNTTIGISVMIISCIAVYQLIYFQKYVAQKTDSMIVKGDSLHYVSDFFMNICVMISLILSKYFVYVDVVCGVTVGAYVFYNALLIMKNALNDLMDEALPVNIQNKIMKTIMSISGIEKVKILRTRSAGMKKYVEVRILIDKKLTFLEAHEISQFAENEIKKMFDNVDVIVKAEL